MSAPLSPGWTSPTCDIRTDQRDIENAAVSSLTATAALGQTSPTQTERRHEKEN
jgi:hypothetical protein